MIAVIARIASADGQSSLPAGQRKRRRAVRQTSGDERAQRDVSGRPDDDAAMTGTPRAPGEAGAIAAPAPVATPLPPLNPMNGDQQCPATAATAAAATHCGSKPSRSCERRPEASLQRSRGRKTSAEALRARACARHWSRRCHRCRRCADRCRASACRRDNPQGMAPTRNASDDKCDRRPPGLARYRPSSRPRKLIRIAVPVKPNASRSLFSR